MNLPCLWCKSRPGRRYYLALVHDDGPEKLDHYADVYLVLCGVCVEAFANELPEALEQAKEAIDRRECDRAIGSISEAFLDDMEGVAHEARD